MNLLEPEGRFWSLFTPWHGDDLNARLKKNPAFSALPPADRPGFRAGLAREVAPRTAHERKDEIGSASFARGYQLMPLADEDTPIRPEWVRFWTEPAQYDYGSCRSTRPSRPSAKADASALVVLGKTIGRLSKFGFSVPESQQIHVLEATARRVTAPNLMMLIDDCDQRWNPDVILFESNAAFLGIKDLLVQHARFGPRVKGITQSSDKGARVAGFSVAVENGSVRLKGDGAVVDEGQRSLFDEMITFPYGDRDDLLDAAATGAAHLLAYREPRIW